MTQKIFLMYAGTMLVSSIALFAVVKNMSSSFSNQGKRPLFFNIGTSIFSGGAAFLVNYITSNTFNMYWILSLIFLLFGTLFMLLIYKKYFKIRADNRNKQIFSAIIYAVSIILLSVAIFSSLQYFIKDEKFMFFPTMVCALFFLVPILLMQTFDAAISIPTPLYYNWKYPLQKTIDLPDEKEGEHLYVIGFKIAKKTTDKKHTYFRAKAPEDMLLGDLFYHFINDYNELHSETTIEYAANNISNEWQFRTRPKWYQSSRRLNPTETVNENKIKENTVIICDRIAES